MKIEHFAARNVACVETIGQLKSLGVNSALKFASVGSTTAPLQSQLAETGHTHEQLEIPVIFVRTSQLLQDLSSDGPIFGEFTELSYSHFNSDTSQVIMAVKGAMGSRKRDRRDLDKVNAALAAIEDDAVHMSQKGHFELRITTPLGTGFAAPLAAQLRGLARLRTFVTVINRHGYRIDNLRLSTLSFTYNQASGSPLGVKLLLPNSSSPKQTITVEFPPDSPHRRIGPILQTFLNESSFEAFIGSLEMTLPAVRAFDAIEALPDSIPSNPAIHAHRPDSYKLTYTNPPLTLQIGRRNLRDIPEWQIADAHQFTRNPDGSERSPDFQKALMDHCTHQQGEGWRGNKNYVQADTSARGLQGALLALDKVIREFSVPTASGNKEQETSKGTGTEAGAGQRKAKANGAAGEHEIITIMD
jgi:hypothetical protein